MPPKEVFLSHSSQDRATAEKIAELLRAHGVPTFYSPHNLIGAQQWQDEILKALQRCDWFVVLLSPDAIQSLWVPRETAMALNDRRYDNKIIPVMYRDCDLGMMGWLNAYQMVDLRLDFAAGARNLLKVWGVGMKE